MSPLYSRVLRIAASFVGDEKAKGVLERQLAANGGNPATFDAAQMKKMLAVISSGLKLYIADPVKKGQLVEEMNRIANS